MQRVIYPSYRGPLAFNLLLGSSKLLRCVAFFLLADLLSVKSLLNVAFLIYFWSSVCLVLIQKPYSSGKRLVRSQWIRVGRFAFFTLCTNLLCMLGLTLCGPLRTILLTEHADIIIVTAFSALVAQSQGSGKVRGVVFFLLGCIAIAFFDHDSLNTINYASDDVSKQSGYLPVFISDLVEYAGLSDHKGGVFLLLLSMLLRTALQASGRKLAVEVGGAKRLHALTMLLCAVLTTPLALVDFFSQTSEAGSAAISAGVTLLLCGAVALILHVTDYYLESVCSSHLEPLPAARCGTLVMQSAALLLAQVAPHPLLHLQSQLSSAQHQLSAGVVFAFVMLVCATIVLSSRARGRGGGSLVGFSAGGLPLYSHTGGAEASRHHAASLSHTLKSVLQHILHESDSRRIFYFLCLNLTFTFVELVYGGWTNSLGLISDGFHMLFDCTALVMGLYAAVMSKWQPSGAFSFGYDRVEILSGFVNGLFLTVIAFFIFLESVHRLLDPPTVNTDKLLTVSILGLLVNLVGIFAFQGAMHGHSHGGSSHGHSHGSHAHSHGGEQSGVINSNMRGVFLHVLADTLGSVGVIISALLIEHFGWSLSDPLCSLFIAGMISLSVMPLLRETASVLVLEAPPELHAAFYSALHKVRDIDGVLSCKAPRLWRHSGKVVWATLHVVASSGASEQLLASQVSFLVKEIGVTHVSVQIEKEAYYNHRMGLGSTPESADDSLFVSDKLNFDSDLISVKAI